MITNTGIAFNKNVHPLYSVTYDRHEFEPWHLETFITLAYHACTLNTFYLNTFIFAHCLVEM